MRFPYDEKVHVAEGASRKLVHLLLHFQLKRIMERLYPWADTDKPSISSTCKVESVSNKLNLNYAYPGVIWGIKNA